ncbi:hypothetical protein Agabi119p4_9065 [Agaricus bisporus var. burnettii]|uniref:SHSP domain-containing protein n=1 Tax=Agaricus bisporus var. burnettii TaxID=192524 RepID=A0A8H7C574_AGABI|nr:hypothetical protein Agabi119p4_9065 [Agaricus bisporus var. burnettii]
MSPTTSSPVPSKSNSFASFYQDPRFRTAVSRAAQLKVHQLIEAGSLRPGRPERDCRGNWKPRMDLVDDPSSPNIIAIFELPGVKNENISLQIKEKRLMVFGKRVDPYSEALSAALAAVSSSQDQKSARTGATEVDQASSRGNARSSPPPNSQDPAVKSSTSRSIHELRYGSFFRSVTVPEGIKQSEVTAGIQDGMLTVTWPRIPAGARHFSATKISDTPIETMANQPMLRA